MATVFQNLNKLMTNKDNPMMYQSQGGMSSSNDILFSTTDKNEYDTKMMELKQQKLLSHQWLQAGKDTSMANLNGYSAVRLMYRDANLMETFPEIGAALDVVSEEATCLNSKGQMLKINSPSKRIKSVLEDLFINRLNINTTLPMITREMLKYGNSFHLLNIDMNNGILGWKKLPVDEIDRIENGFSSVSPAMNYASNKYNPDEVSFVWQGHNNNTPFKNWQIAHFRMLNDSFFLPFGTSYLHKARRAWRMLSMMEDAMLIYRLDKSVERRVFKIFVGGIDDADVPAFVQDVANNFKRTPIVDPQTGQIDLRQNILASTSDYFIPVRSESSPNPIETLQGAQNQTSMDDINYMRDKILCALRVPKTFLNYQEAQGKGQNLSLMDIRFCRMVNKVQQYLLLELNKIAMIHLYMCGFTDDITNFTLSMNNPSAQIEALELEDLTKRIQTASSALADPGIGMPIMSLHKVLKEIMKMSDNEIKDMLNEIRIEKAMAAELAATPNVIKKTGLFDVVDNIYGDPNAAPAAQQQGQGEGPMGGGPAGGGDMGGSLNFDSLGGGLVDMGGGGEDIGGSPAQAPLSQAPDIDNGTPQPLQEKTMKKSLFEQYFKMLEKSDIEENELIESQFDYVGKNINITKNLKENIKILNESTSKINEFNKELEEEVSKLKKDADSIEIL